MHFWEAGDAVTHSVAWLLLAMSLLSWVLILSKGWSAWRLRSGARAAIEKFWNAPDADAALRTGRFDGVALDPDGTAPDNGAL